MIPKMTDLDMFFHICVVKILSHPSHITPVKIPLSFTVRENIYKLNKELITVEPGYNEPLYNKVLGITNDFLCHSNSKTYGKEGPRNNETSL